MRLVDADALKEWGEVVPLTDDGGIDINDFEERLVSMPTIEAEPVKHGRWEFEAKWQYKNCDGRGMERKEIFGTTKRTFNRLKCSKCKKAVVIDDTIAYAYCPHCGAKMDLGGEPHEQN